MLIFLPNEGQHEGRVATKRSAFWHLTNAAVITSGEAGVLKRLHQQKETIKLLYASRSEAVFAHCLVWIAWSPIEPLHFGDLSIFEDTSIEIRMFRQLLSPTLLSFSWLTREIDTRLRSFQKKRFNPPLIALIVPSILWQRVWLHGNTEPHCARSIMQLLSFLSFLSNCIKISFVSRV